jgi:hypothetical protein
MAVTTKNDTISGAFDHVIEASQRMIVARLDLLRLEAREDLLTTTRVFTQLVVATILGTSSWFLLVALAVRALADEVSLVASLGIIAALHVVVAVLLAVAAMRDLGHMKVLRPDEPEPSSRPIAH